MAEMTYNYAIRHIKEKGGFVKRPHWNWAVLGYSPHNDMLFLDCEDGERKAYTPDKSDLKATDWDYAYRK